MSQYLVIKERVHLPIIFCQLCWTDCPPHTMYSFIWYSEAIVRATATQSGGPIESYVTIFSDQGKSTSAHYILSIVLDRLSAAYNVFLYLIFKAIVREQWSLSSRMASCPSVKTFVSLTKYPMGHYLMIRNVYEAVGLSDSNGYTLSNVGFTDSDPLPFGHVPNAYVVSSGQCVWHTYCI